MEQYFCIRKSRIREKIIFDACWQTFQSTFIKLNKYCVLRNGTTCLVKTIINTLQRILLPSIEKEEMVGHKEWPLFVTEEYLFSKVEKTFIKYNFVAEFQCIDAQIFIFWKKIIIIITNHTFIFNYVLFLMTRFYNNYKKTA